MSAVTTRTPEAVPATALASSFLRTLLIQASWNYHTMLGSGFAFAMLPVLRRIYRDRPDELNAALDRHLEHFNAHPYLASVALGAAVRLEADGTDPETVRRLKVAIRGPLGSLGDALVWALVLPGASLGALAVIWLGAPVWLGVAGFLVVYNVVHLGLRFWGFRAGLEAGRDVGRRLGAADLSGWTRRLEPVVVLLLGLLVGAVLGGDRGLVEAGAPWVAAASVAFLVGLLGGHRTWRPAAVLTVVAIGALSVAGVLA